LKNTSKVFEVLPDSLLPVQFDTLQVPIAAYSPYDTGVNGNTNIAVTRENDEDLELKLAFNSGRKVWPTLPASYGGNPNDNNILKGISVQVLKDGKPAENQEVKISASMILPSGGHKHTDQPANLGIIRDLDTGNTSNGAIVVSTNKEGRVPLEYITNPFGGGRYSSQLHIHQYPEFQIKITF